jgi:hypothetical protein
MGKMATALDGKLPEFQKYLLEKNLVPTRMCLSTPIESADFSIMREEMNFQLWNIRSLRF